MASYRIFVAKLAGATFRDRLIASIGALLGIAVTAFLCAMWKLDAAWPAIVAPMGASAVLMFAVPASPLAQPWAVLGGNVISATIGVMVTMLVPDPAIAAGLAVGLAILVMSLCRCLHPPGGAAALTAVVGGPAIATAGFAFPFAIIAGNSLVLIAMAWLFHRFSGHSYPHRPASVRPRADLLARADIDAALAEFGETFDIAPEDLELLLQRAEAHAVRHHR